MKKSFRSWIVISLHWLLVLVVLISFFSGMRIASDHLYSSTQRLQADGILKHWLQWLPQGAVFEWHWASAVILLVALASYIVFITLRQRWQQLLPSKTLSLAENINRILLLSGLLLLMTQCLFGLVISFEQRNAALFVSLHRFTAWALLIYLFVHPAVSFLLFGWQRLQTIFIGTNKHSTQGLLALLFITPLLMVLYLSLHRELIIPLTQLPPLIDGSDQDSAWQQQPFLQITTRHQQIALHIKATHDRERLYLLLRWPDPTPTHQHLPLIKTVQGWQLQQQQYALDDERHFYEDKLAVMISNGSLLDAIRSIHLGADILSQEKMPRHQRGFHFTRNGRILDIWHWKALRSDPLYQADDSYFGPALSALQCEYRYTAGYHADPASAGGHKANYHFFNQQVIPLRLPQGSVADAAWMRWSDGNAYSHQADSQFPIGSVIPGIVNVGPFEGDRGDVGAKASWQDGYWTLEMSRELEANSGFDQALQQHTLLWFAVFDNAQTRHSYHLLPLHLNFEELPDHDS